jgi:hypothetical protein
MEALRRSWWQRGLVGVALVATCLGAACGGDETTTAVPTTTVTATSTVVPGTTTATATTTGSPTATTGSTATSTGTATSDLRGNFPQDVQNLLTDLPDNLVELLWKVRQAGPDTMYWSDYGGETHQTKRRAYIEEWEQIAGWTVENVPITGSGSAPAGL